MKENFENWYNETKNIRLLKENKLKVKTGNREENAELKKNYTNQIVSKEAKLKREVLLAFSDGLLIYELYNKFAEVELVHKYGKINAYETFAKLRETDFGLFNAAMFLSNHKSRSDVYSEHNNAWNVKFGSIVPIFMSAHKEHNGIMYEEWDKKESAHPALVVGRDLWYSMKPYLEPIVGLDTKLKELRDEAYQSSKANTYTSYFLKAICYIQDGKKVRVPMFISHIKGQFWLANVSKRTDLMILDTTNWDNMPEPFDDSNSLVEVALVQEKEDEALPW